MNWKYFCVGVGFLAFAYLYYRIIKRRKQSQEKNKLEGLISVLDVETWGMMILTIIVGIGFIIKSLF